ncbi:alpha/beta fold hydrolase [Alkalicoccus luteus]|uniref:alpha/beta fold hydrolase n=1 Tax=Alkalicoccus luteus TaxID=1237094 RepID=UPI004034DDFF
MAHQIETAPGVHLHVEDEGSGKPVIFIHGWPLNAAMFHRQKQAVIENGHRYIGIDLRGFGRSDQPEENYIYDTFASDILAVVKELELEQYSLVGFSMGGPVAIRYAVKYAGEQLEQLFLLGPAAPSFTKRMGYSLGMEKEDVDDLMEAIDEDREKALQDFGGNFFYQDVSEEAKQELFDLSMRASKQATISAAAALRDEDLRDEAGHIRVPVSIFHGRHDAICEFGFAEELEQRIPTVTVVPFEESGHGLHVEEPDKLNKELLQRL